MTSVHTETRSNLNISRLSIHHLGLTVVDDVNKAHGLDKSSIRHDFVTSRQSQQLQSPPLTPHVPAAHSPPSSYGPLSSHPTSTHRLKTKSSAGRGTSPAPAPAHAQPLTPPSSHKSSDDSTPNFTTAPAIPFTPDLRIPTPVDSTPRTYIPYINQRPASPVSATRPSSGKRLQRRNSASSRSILSLSVRHSLGPSAFFSKNKDSSNQSSGSSIFSFKKDRRPDTAHSGKPTNHSGFFCMPVAGNGQQLYTTDGRPVSQRPDTASDAPTPEAPSRKSATWFRRPSSLFLRHLGTSEHGKDTSANESVSSPEHTPELVQDMSDSPHNRPSMDGASAVSDYTSEDGMSIAPSRCFDTAPYLPPLGVIGPGALTGGDIGGEGIFDHVGKD